MRNKKGIELSVTVIILLIITIIIFVIAVSLIMKWFGKAETLKAELDKQTEMQIANALKRANTLVAIPINIKQVPRSKSTNFGIGVRNIGSTKTFSGKITLSGAYTPDGQRISTYNSDYINNNWLGNFQNIDDFQLVRNQQKILPIPIKADTYMAQNQMTLKGDYVFNVCIYDSIPVDCIIENLKEMYTNKIYQITVRVV